MAREEVHFGVPAELSREAAQRAGAHTAEEFVSVENGSDYCLNFHMDFGLRAGLTHKQIDALRDNPKGGEFTEKEQLVIEYADLVTRDPSAVSKELFSRLRTYFDDSQMINLTLLISLLNVFSRYADALNLTPGH